MTFAEARRHSPAQLRLLAEAAERVRARQALVDLEVSVAAAGAAWGSDKQLKATARKLTKIAA
jgi:hypothetical protein